MCVLFFFFFSSRRRHTRLTCDWSSDVCSSDLHFLSATQLGLLLADHRPLRLVVLNSCEGARGGKLDIFSSAAATLVRRRSEERRVGKECRSRWWRWQ